MPWPWSKKRLTGKAAEDAVNVIRHLQTQMALQQLLMEIYNDALAEATSSPMTGDEVLLPSVGWFNNADLIRTKVIPASERKVSIAESMVAEHSAFPAGDGPLQALEAYENWGRLLGVLLARARLQLTCWRDWAEDPSRDVSIQMNSLDAPEREAMITAIAALNVLIARAGVAGARWEGIRYAAFNEVRSRVDLPPLTELDFQSRLMQGTVGGRARFFNRE